MIFMIKKPETFRSRKYLDWIAQQPCIISRHKPNDREDWNDPCHFGFGAKPDDTRAIPMRHKYHVEQHQIGEKTFAEKYNIDYQEEIIKHLTKYFKEFENENNKS